MKARRYVALGVAVFAYMMLTHAPAATLYGWLKPDEEPMVELHGLDGTLGEGRLAGVAVANRTVARDLQWRLLPWHLLLLDAAFAIHSGDPATVLEGRAAISPTGALTLRDVQAALAVKNVVAAAGFPYLTVDGQARLQIGKLRVAGGIPTDASGSVDVQGLAWTLARDPMMLGDYHADVTTEADQILVKFQSTSGPLDLSGDAKLSSEGAYELHVQLKTQPGAQPLLQEFLRPLGSPDPSGYYHLRRQGQLPRADAT